MVRFLTKYHEFMANFWYVKNSALRDYHERKRDQLRSMPEAGTFCGIGFRSYKRDIELAAQAIAIAMFFLIIMLGIMARFL